MRSAASAIDPGKPEIVCVHGAFCGGWTFDGFADRFGSAGHAVWAPNLPHHNPGADRRRLASCGLRDFADALSTALRKRPAPVVLVGHSMGGLVAQIVAARSPDHVAGLALLATSPPWGVAPTSPDEVSAAIALYALGDFWNQAIDPVYAPARQYSLDRLERTERRAAFARFVPESGLAAFQTLNRGIDMTMAAAAPAAAIRCPVLFLGGGQDRLSPPSTQAAIAARFPARQAERFVFDPMSHWLIGEPGWQAVADTVIDWAAHRI